MSVALLDARDFGAALACGILALQDRGLPRGEMLNEVRRSAAALATAAQANRKMYAVRYGEIPGPAPSADEIMQAAKPMLSKATQTTSFCAPGNAMRTPVNTIMAHTDPRHVDADAGAALEELHKAIAIWNPRNTQKAARREADARIEVVASGRYPWMEVTHDSQGRPAIQDKRTNTFTKDLAQALKEATGRSWSVKHGSGTGYGYVSVDAPPKRRVCEWDGKTRATTGHGYSCEDDRQVLGNLLNDGRPAHSQGETISPDPGCRERAYDLVRGHPEPAACRRDWDR